MLSIGPLGFIIACTASVKPSWTIIGSNFVGSPSVYFAFAVPQDGIAKPSDFNATASGYIKKVWDGTALQPATSWVVPAGGYVAFSSKKGLSGEGDAVKIYGPGTDPAARQLVDAQTYGD